METLNLAPFTAAARGADETPVIPWWEPGTDDGIAAIALRMLAVLQTTLEPESLIRRFSEAVVGHVPHDGYLYRHGKVESAWGLQLRHECRYRLTMGERSLGELVLFRRRPFGDDEMGLLDRLLWCLVYPLRNALDYRRVRECALRDALTGAKNRAGFDEDVQRAVAMARRSRRPLSLLVLDIDHFKAVNDSHGHAVGDEAIKAIAACAARHARDADAFYRYGGEEFVLLLDDTNLDGAERVAERIRAAVAARPHDCHGRELLLSVSIGAAQLALKEDGAELFRRADEALYQAKRSGRNRVYRAP